MVGNGCCGIALVGVVYGWVLVDERGLCLEIFNNRNGPKFTILGGSILEARAANFSERAALPRGLGPWVPHWCSPVIVGAIISSFGQSEKSSSGSRFLGPRLKN